MCIICVSKAGVNQPTADRIRTMFDNNPHGAGYMHVKGDRVIIHKGFMDCEGFIDQLRLEGFTSDDVVIYHFRISTQAGINPEMTHPFPLTNAKEYLTALDVECACGVAHNGIIHMTSTKAETDMSDTALFVQKYMPHIIRTPDDLKKPDCMRILSELIGYSKLAIVDNTGYVATVGHFITDDDGLLYSNDTYKDIALCFKNYPYR